MINNTNNYSHNHNTNYKNNNNKYPSKTTTLSYPKTDHPSHNRTTPWYPHPPQKTSNKKGLTPDSPLSNSTALHSVSSLDHRINSNRSL